MDRNLATFSTHDPLTGALNRRNCVSGVASQIELTRRRGIPLSYIMLDIDHFQVINDTHGSAAGDNVLISVAGTLRRHFRSSDYVFRYGGEEFAVVLSNADESGAAICAGRCRQEIAEMVFPAYDRMRITVSCGVAEVDSFCITPMELTDRADLALRLAKKWDAIKSSATRSVNPMGYTVWESLSPRPLPTRPRYPLLRSTID